MGRQALAALVTALSGGWGWDDAPAPRGVFARPLPPPPAWLRKLVDSYHAHPRTYAVAFGIVAATFEAWLSGGDVKSTLLTGVVAALPGARVPGRPAQR